MKEQLMQLAGAAIAAGVAAVVTAVVVYARAHVQSEILRAMLDAVVKGVEEGDHPETKAAIQVVAEAKGVQQHLDAVVQKTTGGAA